MTNIFKKYSDYANDNPKHLWFKRKLYGWGWTPVTWQGWLTILLFLITILTISFSLPKEPTDSQLAWFFISLIIVVALLIGICYAKGETPRWQWGIPKKDHDNL